MFKGYTERSRDVAPPETQRFETRIEPGGIEEQCHQVGKSMRVRRRWKR
jgi:hypothetical protein